MFVHCCSISTILVAQPECRTLMMSARGAIHLSPVLGVKLGVLKLVISLQLHLHYTATQLHLFASICTGHMLTQKLAENQHQQITKPLKSL